MRAFHVIRMAVCTRKDSNFCYIPRARTQADGGLFQIAEIRPETGGFSGGEEIKMHNIGIKNGNRTGPQRQSLRARGRLLQFGARHPRSSDRALSTAAESLGLTSPWRASVQQTSASRLKKPP